MPVYNPSASTNPSNQDPAGKQQQGTGFVNLNRMLQANVGAGQQLGQTIGANIQGQAQNVLGQAQQAQTQFNTGLQQGTNLLGNISTARENLLNQPTAQQVTPTGTTPQTQPPEQQNQPSQPTYNPSTAPQARQQTTTQLPSAPSSGRTIQMQPTREQNYAANTAQLQSNVTAPQQSTNADYYSKIAAYNPNQGLEQLGKEISGYEYTGPMGLKGTEDLSRQAATVSALGQMAGTRAGQEQLLRNMIAKGSSYGSGASALDQILLAQQGIPALQQNIGSSINAASQVNTGVEQAKQQASNLAKEIAQSKLNLFGDVTKSAQDIYGQAYTANEKLNQDIQDVKDYLSDPDLFAKNHPDKITNTVNNVRNLNQYGLNTNQRLYTNAMNPEINAAIKQGLINASQGLTGTSEGGLYFNVPQQQAALTALNQFLTGGDAIRGLNYNPQDIASKAVDPTKIYTGDFAKDFSTNLALKQADIASANQFNQRAISGLSGLQIMRPDLYNKLVNEGLSENLSDISGINPNQYPAYTTSDWGANPQIGRGYATGYFFDAMKGRVVTEGGIPRMVYEGAFADTSSPFYRGAGLQGFKNATDAVYGGGPENVPNIVANYYDPAAYELLSNVNKYEQALNPYSSGYAAGNRTLEDMLNSIYPNVGQGIK